MDNNHNFAWVQYLASNIIESSNVYNSNNDSEWNKLWQILVDSKYSSSCSDSSSSCQ